VFDTHHKAVPPLLAFGFLGFGVTVLDEEAFIQILEDEVEEGDHLDREVDKLVVELSIVILEVGALHFEDGALEQLELVQLVAVDELGDGLTLLHPGVLEVQDEPLEGVDHLLHRYIGAVDDSHVIAGLRVGVLHVLRRARVVGALMDAVGHVEVGTRLEGSPSGSVPGI
jgi:hypothetical protein